jgi:hypothetical protein
MLRLSIQIYSGVKKGHNELASFNECIKSRRQLTSWCTNADVKITLPDDLETDVKEISELIDDSVNDNSSGCQ